jgi:hypothetical protein
MGKGSVVLVAVDIQFLLASSELFIYMIFTFFSFDLLPVHMQCKVAQSLSQYR